MIKTLLSFLILLGSLAMVVHGQQSYSGLSAQNCDDSRGSGLYTCNGQQRSCRAFLIFKARPRFNTVRTISKLTLSSPEELSRINNEAEYDAVFPANKEVIVPVNCSCSGRDYYQANSSITVSDDATTYYRVATELFQGLSTCGSIERENRPLGEYELAEGSELRVPLRCACPTEKQIEKYGAKYMLTYPVNEGDNIPDIAKRFDVSSIRSVFEANYGLLSSENDYPIIFTGVSILIPLPSEPLSSQTVTHHKSDKPTRPFGDFWPRKLGPSKRNNHFVVVFSTLAGCSVLAFVIIIFLVRKKRERPSPDNATPPSPVDLRIEIASLENKGLREFGIEEIGKATSGFSPGNLIKGSVYRGVFGGLNGKAAGAATFAVKKTAKREKACREVAILKRLNHFNLIKLEGVCTDRDHGGYYMVFEYMEKGSLREWLLSFNDDNSNDDGEDCRSRWRKRIEIALDVAHGLDYLHSFAQPGYVHKNIKTSNILLNKDARAKIANFGLAGPADTDRTASHVVGTRGYVAPEYLATGVSTTKIDVFAFGVVVAELLSGKKAMGVEDGKRVLLSTRIAEIMESNGGDVSGIESFVECGLKGDERFREFGLRVAELSVACLNIDPERRPTMSEVVSSLSKILADLHTT